jgi:hypothetical protein
LIARSSCFRRRRSSWSSTLWEMMRKSGFIGIFRS